MVQGVYRIDYAPSARAVCQSTTCMKPKCKIRKGAIRVGVMVEVPNRFSKSGEHSTIQSMKWRHSYCMTKQTINNMKKTFSEDVDDFDGFDELTEEDRQEFKQIFDRGEVLEEEMPKWLVKDQKRAWAELNSEPFHDSSEDEAKKVEEQEGAKGKGKAKKKNAPTLNALAEKAAPGTALPTGTPKKGGKSEDAESKPKQTKKKKGGATKRKHHSDEESELSDAQETPENSDEEKDSKKKVNSQAKKGKGGAQGRGKGSKKAAVKGEPDVDGIADDGEGSDNDVPTSEDEVMPIKKQRGGISARGRNSAVKQDPDAQPNGASSSTKKAGTAKGANARGDARGKKQAVKSEPVDDDDEGTGTGALADDSETETKPKRGRGRPKGSRSTKKVKTEAGSDE
ncbi:unnamed protein product [Jaminaea pallidilutea]